MTYIKGSNELKNFEVVKNYGGSYSMQQYSTTLVAMTGTEVAYTPSSDSSVVVYECYYTIYWNPDGSGSYSCIRLQESTDDGSTWSTISGTKAMEGTSGSADYDTFCMNFKFILSPWTGAKKLRLATRSHTTSTEFTVGKLYTSSSVTTTSCPQVIVYEI